MSSPLFNTRARFHISQRFQITEEFRDFAKSYVPNFSAGAWRAIREVLTDLFFLIENREADLIKIARPLIDKGGKSERISVSKLCADWFSSHGFSDPGACLEIAYRCHQSGRDLNKLVVSLEKLQQRRNKLMDEKRAQRDLDKALEAINNE